MADSGNTSIDDDGQQPIGFQLSISSSSEKDEVEVAEMYTPTFLWQTLGMWQEDYLGYTETLEEAEKVLQEYEICTGSKFIVSYKRVNFGKTFLELHQAKHKVIWQIKDNQDKSAIVCSSLVIPFDGVPFIFAGKKVFECRHGQDKGVGAKLRWKKMAKEKLKTDPKFKVRSPRTQPSVKVGCRAQVHITHIIRFPEYEIVSDSAYWRRMMSSNLKHSMLKSPGTIQVSERFYITLTDPKDHSNHDLKDAEMARKAHMLRMQAQDGYKKVKRRKQVIDTTSDIPVHTLDESETALTQSPEIPMEQMTSSAGPAHAPVASAATKIHPQTGRDNSTAASRCAKVLERLIDATFLVENADKLVELERKANELLQEASTGIESVERDPIGTGTDVHAGAAHEGSQTRGQKRTAGEVDAETIPVTESIEYVHVPLGGAPPSVIYTYGADPNMLKCTPVVSVTAPDQ